MDIVEEVLSHDLLPCLSDSSNILRLIWKTVQPVSPNQRRLHTLAYFVAELLQAVDREYRAGRLLEAVTFAHFKTLVK